MFVTVALFIGIADAKPATARRIAPKRISYAEYKRVGEEFGIEGCDGEMVTELLLFFL